MKRTIITAAISIILMMLLCGGSTLITSASPTEIKGDVNGSESIELADAIKLSKYLVMADSLSSNEKQRADIDENEKVNIYDSSLLKWGIIEGKDPQEFLLKGDQTTTTTTTGKTTTTTTTTTPKVTAGSTSATSRTEVTLYPEGYPYEDVNELVEMCVKEVQADIWAEYDLEFPYVEDDSVYNGAKASYYEEAAYIFKFENKMYAYSTIGWRRKSSSLFREPSDVAGALLWEIPNYSGPWGTSDYFTIPDYTGKVAKSEWSKKEYPYSLSAYNEINVKDISTVAAFIVNEDPLEMGNYYWILLSKYDYDLNGKLNRSDLRKMIAWYMSNKPTHLQNYRLDPDDEYDFAFDEFEYGNVVKTVFGEGKGPYIWATPFNYDFG